MTYPKLLLNTAAAAEAVQPDNVTVQSLLAGYDGSLLNSSGGVATAAIAAAAAGPTVIKASAGRLCRIVVTATGTGAMTFYDNASAASGVALFIIPANAAVGSFYDVSMPSANGITAAGGATMPGVTVSFV